MTVKAAIRGQGRAILNNALANRETFETSGALSATTYSTGSGRLIGDDLIRFRQDVNAISYVVYSYATPIAWVANGEVYHVSQRFSATTSKHQGAVRTYLR